jgi:hypothetical protein
MAVAELEKARAHKEFEEMEQFEAKLDEIITSTYGDVNKLELIEKHAILEARKLVIRTTEEGGGPGNLIMDDNELSREIDWFYYGYMLANGITC